MSSAWTNVSYQSVRMPSPIVRSGTPLGDVPRGIVVERGAERAELVDGRPQPLGDHGRRLAAERRGLLGRVPAAGHAGDDVLAQADDVAGDVADLPPVAAGRGAPLGRRRGRR